MPKSRQETDNARETQYSIGHAPQKILVRTALAALALSAAIHFVMKNSAPCFAVLCHSPSSWAAIVHLSGWMLMTKEKQLPTADGRN